MKLVYQTIQVSSEKLNKTSHLVLDDKDMSLICLPLDPLNVCNGYLTIRYKSEQ